MSAVRVINLYLALTLVTPLLACSSSDEPSPQPNTPGSTAGAGGSGGTAGSGGGQGATGSGGTSGAGVAGGGGTGGSAGSSAGGGTGGTAQPTCTPITQACDPFGSDSAASCDESHECRALESGETECSCPSTFAGPQNAPCSAANECQMGFVCQSGTCRTLCDPSAATSNCEGGLPCKPLLEGSEYGYCDS